MREERYEKLTWGHPGRTNGTSAPWLLGLSCSSCTLWRARTVRWPWSPLTTLCSQEPSFIEHFLWPLPNLNLSRLEFRRRALWEGKVTTSHPREMKGSNYFTSKRTWRKQPQWWLRKAIVRGTGCQGKQPIKEEQARNSGGGSEIIWIIPPGICSKLYSLAPTKPFLGCWITCYSKEQNRMRLHFEFMKYPNL